MYLALLFFYFIISDYILNTLSFIKKPQQAYYINHVVLNSLVVYNTLPSLYYFFFDLDKFFKEDYTFVGSIINVLHIYHTLMYIIHMNYEDLIHHITTFILTYCGIYYAIGGYGNILAFFICGLPGIFYYLPLVLSITGFITRNYQKMINFYANMARLVGIIFSSSIIIFGYRLDYLRAPWIIIVLNTGIPVGNAVYYYTQVVKQLQSWKAQNGDNS